MAKKTFEQWFAEADAACRKAYGLSLSDLPDCPYQDWYATGKTPKGAASKAWKLAKED